MFAEKFSTWFIQAKITNLTSSKQKKKIENPKIVCLNVELEVKKKTKIEKNNNIFFFQS